MERIHKREFPLPDVTDPSYFIQGALIDKDGKIEGAYFTRITSEIVLIIDEDLSALKRARYIKEVSEDVLGKCLSQGIKSTHLFVTPESDTHYCRLLEKHFGFVRATGIPMYWEIE